MGASEAPGMGCVGIQWQQIQVNRGRASLNSVRKGILQYGFADGLKFIETQADTVRRPGVIECFVGGGVFLGEEELVSASVGDGWG